MYDFLESKKEEYLGYLTDLLAINTECIGHGIDGGKEKEGQEYLYKLLKKIGADYLETDQMEESVIQETIRKHGEGNPQHVYTDRYNVYAEFKGKDSETARSIIFNGHMDTMPAGDLEKWDHDPWEPTIKDGKLYGRGAADMKAGLLAPILAIDLLKKMNYQPKGDVKIISVADEEGGGNGSIQAAMRGITADAAVVCEPTDDELIVAHMGFVFFNIELEGFAIHAGHKFKGVSAIEKAQKVIRELYDLEHTWLPMYKHPLLPAPSINIGVIEGGTAGSTVADHCIIKICVHYLPSIMSREQIEKEIKEALLRVQAGDDWLREHPIKFTIYQSGGGFEQAVDSEVVTAFQSAYKAVRKKEVAIVGSPAGCDSRIWSNIAKIPTLQFGPGTLAQCHAVNEHIELEDFWNSIIIYAELIKTWCDMDK